MQMTLLLCRNKNEIKLDLNVWKHDSDNEQSNWTQVKGFQSNERET